MGYDWAQHQHSAVLEGTIAANALCVHAMLILPRFQNTRLSPVLLTKMKEIASEMGFSKVVVPVRPTLKKDFPQTTMKEYTVQLNDKGELFDPWLRTHTRIGGRIAGICERSMHFVESKQDWQHILGSHVTEGTIPVGCWQPLQRSQIGLDFLEYVEENVWVIHDIQRQNIVSAAVQTLSLNEVITCAHKNTRDTTITTGPPGFSLATDRGSTPPIPELCVHELFERQAAATPDAVALVFEGAEMTYTELDARTAAVAVGLQAAGVVPPSKSGDYS